MNINFIRDRYIFCESSALKVGKISGSLTVPKNGRSKLFWGSLENEVKKPGVSGHPMKVYLDSKPSGKTGGFLNKNEKETAFLRLRLQKFFIFVQKYLTIDGDAGEHFVCAQDIEYHIIHLATLFQFAFNGA